MSDDIIIETGPRDRLLVGAITFNDGESWIGIRAQWLDDQGEWYTWQDSGITIDREHLDALIAALTAQRIDSASPAPTPATDSVRVAAASHQVSEERGPK